MARLDISSHLFNVGMLQESGCVEIAYKKLKSYTELDFHCIKCQKSGILLDNFKINDILPFCPYVFYVFHPPKSTQPRGHSLLI